MNDTNVALAPRLRNELRPIPLTSWTRLRKCCFSYFIRRVSGFIVLWHITVVYLRTSPTPWMHWWIVTKPSVFVNVFIITDAERSTRLPNTYDAGIRRWTDWTQEFFRTTSGGSGTKRLMSPRSRRASRVTSGVSGELESSSGLSTVNSESSTHASIVVTKSS
jgi:hypothetical protein